MDGIKFGLARMEAVYSQAKSDETVFKNSIDEIYQLINEIGALWTSEETGTYEAFKKMFDDKYPRLDEGDKLMETFCNKIEQKKTDFAKASSDSLSLFE